jgi:hypothetical protein|tara:strand:+ start:13677 stop:15785 length:2109 start_codon:yes stop_codon:yes gene_type:complete
MYRDMIEGYDFSKDMLKPMEVLDHLRAHDNRMDNDQSHMALAKAAYTTKYWRYIEGQEDYNTNYELTRLDQIEVNRIKPALSGYISSLYPRRIDVVISSSPYTTGDAEKAELVVNDWMNQPLMRERILSASRQALLYKGSGAKIGYDPAGEGLARVWMRVFPYWEMVLDSDVHDWDDSRFFGHVSYRPKQEIIEEYGLEEEDVGGSGREDYLGSYIAGTKRIRSSEDTSVSDNQEFVRVLEFCNMVDDFYDTDGTRYKGRLEIYILDEGYGDGEHLPIYMGPLPLVDAKGHPMAHIVPLIFEHEPEYPYRGLAYTDQLMPQQKEINALRSFLSNASRRDARVYLARKGALDADAFTDLKSGEDGVIIEVDEQYAGNLSNVVVPIQHGSMSSNLLQTMSLADSDIERQTTLSPAALGQITKATAEEIRAVERHTDSEFGRHAEKRDLWLIEIVERVLAAYVGSFFDVGDSEGAEQHLDSDGEELEQEDLDNRREEEGLDEIGDGESEEPTEIEETQQEEFVPTPEQREAPPSENKLVLQNKTGDLIEISADDLDSDFKIGFAEAGRTPMADAEGKTNLINLMDRMISLFDMMNKGGPMGVMGEELLRSLHDKFELPPNLHPNYLMEKIKQQEAEQPPKQTQEPQQVDPLDQIGQLPPDQAFEQLLILTENDPKMVELINQAKQLSPEEQQQALQMIIQSMKGE